MEVEVERVMESKFRIREMGLIDPLFQPKVNAPSRDGVGKALLELGEKDPNVWVLSADVAESTRVHWFAEKFPKRFVQVGVAEQNMASVAAGIAATGKTVFISAYGVFSPGRNFDQVRVSICYNNANVKIHGSHTGLTVGPDGASHQALEDIAMMRALPDMMVIAPCDAEQARRATIEAGNVFGQAYVRTSREKMPVFTTDKTPFKIGKANVYREGKDIAIVACGSQVYESLKASEELDREGISCTVIDSHTVKPLDRETIAEYAKKCGLVVTVEEHQIDGGLGSAVCEALSEDSPCRVKRHGVYNRFCESGEPLELLRKYKLDSNGIREIVKETFNAKG